MFTLHNGDNLPFMQSLKDGEFDCLITDPPYGLLAHNMRNAVGFMNIDWDIAPASDEQIAECLRVSKTQIIWGGNYFKLPPSRCMLIWDKGEAMYRRSWAECEIAWTGFDEVSRIFKTGKREEKKHPTQKPLTLMRWCIENYTKPGDTVFDPFMGSGTTGVACLELGRKFVGCEISAEYFAVAEARLKLAAQSPSFLTPSNKACSGRVDSSGSPELFPAEVSPSAKVTRQSARR